jgi:signal transduction histidine kinase
MRIARTMQVLGYALYAIAGLEPGLDRDVHLARNPGWIAAYVVLGIALHVGASTPDSGAGAADAAKHRIRRLASVSVMTPAMLAMAALMPCNFGALTLVVVASQVALALPPRAALGWVVVQTIALTYFLVPTFGWELGSSELIALLGFQGFAVAAVASARGEAQARIALARTNEELLATRSLLDEATRVHERTRIARDLHDVLGHNLTALGLQLEIASHVPEEAARVQVAKARELTTRLLSDVREVVGSMRADRSPTLLAALRELVVEVPGLAVHLDVPESLIVEESCRAECVVRCVQEIVTNARRHACAENLWIRLRRDDDQISVEAHDDGKGAEELRDGHGLRGMRSRIEEMGGWFEVRTAPERAFAISARLPLRGAVAGVDAGVAQ